MPDFYSTIERLPEDALTNAFRAYRADVYRPDLLALSRFMPIRMRPAYDAEYLGGEETSVMAAPTGLDAPYPSGGTRGGMTQRVRTAKLAIAAPRNEKALMDLDDRLTRDRRYRDDSLARERYLDTWVLERARKDVYDPILESAEYLAMRALATGRITWRYIDSLVEEDYGLPHVFSSPAANAWDSTDSDFWDKIAAQDEALEYATTTRIVHPATISKIVGNPANRARITGRRPLAKGQVQVDITKLNSSTGGLSEIEGDTVSLIAYGRYGHILSSEKIKNGEQTKLLKVPFMPLDTVLALGELGQADAYDYDPDSFVYTVGGEAITVAETSGAESVGCVFSGKTVDADGYGQSARVLTPEGNGRRLHFEGEAKVIPLIFDKTQIAIARTA